MRFSTSKPLTAVKVTLRKGKKVVATGKAAKAAGKFTVKLTAKKKPAKGSYTIVLAAKDGTANVGFTGKLKLK